jgi:hypothetical protein
MEGNLSGAAAFDRYDPARISYNAANKYAAIMSRIRIH